MGNELKVIFRKFSKYISFGEFIFHTGLTTVIIGHSLENLLPLEL